MLLPVLADVIAKLTDVVINCLLPILADVIAKLLFPICRLMLLPVYCCWLMLLPWQMLFPICVEDVKPHVFNLCNKCDG